jgi:hypothetical protein
MTVVVAAAFAAGTVGARLASPQAKPHPRTKRVVSAVSHRKAKKSPERSLFDACKPVIRRLSGETVSDKGLQHLLRSNRRCRAMVVHSKPPQKTRTVSAPTIVRRISAPATSYPRTVSATPAGASSSYSAEPEDSAEGSHGGEDD